MFAINEEALLTGWHGGSDGRVVASQCQMNISMYEPNVFPESGKNSAYYQIISISNFNTSVKERNSQIM